MPAEDRAVNAIVARLREEEKEALAAFLERERTGALQDALAAFPRERGASPALGTEIGAKDARSGRRPGRVRGAGNL
jgi:hypothetical protein